MAEILHTRV